MNDYVYCYPGSNTLRNKFDIKDSDLLFSLEKKMSALRLLELWDHPIQGSFDLAHLCKIHQYIFQDLYEWAGEIRTVDIVKGNLFCKVEFLEAEADRLFQTLGKDKLLPSLSVEDMARNLHTIFRK